MDGGRVYNLNGQAITLYRYNTVVVGSGAAGYNAADSLYALGARDAAIVTEDVRAGTSRNAGSDKQTYYKLTLGGGEDDSVAQMAGSLYGGGCVDGDTALCEAALSAECFIKLASLGVPFPKNRYGEWAGYKTDHDPKKRATSAGPYTSRLMTEKLQQAAESKGIPTHDNMLMIKILTGGAGETAGILCLNLAEARLGRAAYAAFICKNAILATGGPAGIYRDTVYPESQHGANGLAFEAGAPGANLTEWQYGLASLRPRWNVSGTFMQALPRFISTAPDGAGEREFLLDYYESSGELLTNVFLKGYQWPFDVRKARGGSSLVDLCVFNETLKGRRVFLDYRDNPAGREIDYGTLGAEARAYLTKAGACFGSPYERLRHMNMPAVEFYREHGVDLAREPLEIALCAQHNNGGISVDAWWRTRVAGLFAAGEVAATHGVFRPGGSALNAGQAGSLRAAQYIAARRRGEALPYDEFIAITGAQITELTSYSKFIPPDSDGLPGGGCDGANRNNSTGARHVSAADLNPEIETARVRMSSAAGAVRNTVGMRIALAQTRLALNDLCVNRPVCGARDLPALYTLRELLICQTAYLSAYIDYAEKGGASRGGALYTDPHKLPPHEKLPGIFAFTPDGGELNGMVQEAEYCGGGEYAFKWRHTRPIPEEDDFFENVWRDYRAGRHIAD